MKRLTTKEDYGRRVDIVVEYIRTHLDSEISLDTLSELSAFSPYHFHRIMRAFLGEPIGAFIVRTRVETATKLLLYTELPIADIAYRVGYDTPSSLTKSFRKFFSVSPKEYRTTKNFKVMTTENVKVEVNLSKPKIRQEEEKQVLYIAQKGKYQDVDYGQLYQKMWGEVKRQGLFSAGIEHLAIFYDDPKVTRSDNLSSEVCLRVVKPAEPNGDIGVKKIRGGKYAVFTFIGPYTDLCHAYDKIYSEWFPSSGYQMGVNPCYEKYVSDPCRVAPEKLKTELYISIE